MALTLPPLQSPAVDPASGLFTAGWIGFFRDLVSGPGPIVSIGVVSSPMTWKSPANGTVAISGGSGVSLQLIRARVTIGLGITQGLVPVSQNDVLQVAYGTAPSLHFIPRGL